MHAIVARAKELEEQLIAWRRDLHAQPECSFQEKKTAAYVVEILTTIPGMVVKTNVGGYGVVGSLKAGSGKTIALRADMDALPITEMNQVPYVSKNPGAMHACGHDAHTAILLGAAVLIGELMRSGTITGTVLFLFQPAEEAMDVNGKTGAVHMIEAGVLKGVDMAFALHVCPWHEKETVQLHKGASMASYDVFKGRIKGTGGHGAYPHLGVDPIWLLSQVLPVLYSVPGRRTSPLEPTVLSIGKIQTGEANNVIPEEVYLEGTIRCYNEKIRESISHEVKRAFQLADVFGGKGSCEIERGEPALINDEDAVEVIKLTAQALYPEEKIVDEPYGLGSEDFAHIAQSCKAAMFFLGCKPTHGQFDLHTPDFQIDETCLIKGTALMAGITLQTLGAEGEEG
ncbi:M20 metallopeptidase family protein [Shouchella patagoniensis]|uniref:M20 metallopeptidase family protein n=1 Tax=Shouchella patagoniensis TaxID=228576 RepID=UPI000995C9CE|nr:amidohydrolase [Shouchella patagoniensis]